VAGRQKGSGGAKEGGKHGYLNKSTDVHEEMGD